MKLWEDRLSISHHDMIRLRVGLRREAQKWSRGIQGGILVAEELF